MALSLPACLVGLALLCATPAYATSCIPAFKARGQRYYAQTVPAGFVTRRGFLGMATGSGCPAGPPASAPPPPATFAIRTYRIRRVHPAVALARSRSVVLLAEGFFPELPGHPLHRLLYEHSTLPNREADSRCRRRTRTVTGRFIKKRRGGLLLEWIPDRTGTAVAIDSRTRVETGRRLGLPFIALGTEIRVRVVRCTTTDSDLDFLLAQRIRIAK